MEFSRTKSYLSKTRDNYFVIGENVLDPLVVIDGKQIIVNKLVVGGADLTVNGATVAGTTDWKEAFELNSDGDLTPTDSDAISDTMWMLSSDGNLQLRANHFRHDSGDGAFTEDVSIS